MQGIDSGLIRIEGETDGDRTVMVYATEQQAKVAFELKNKSATPGLFERQGCLIFAALSSTAAAKVSVTQS
jgi:DNA-binding MarR family transcriptional regulator